MGKRLSAVALACLALLVGAIGFLPPAPPAADRVTDIAARAAPQGVPATPAQPAAGGDLRSVVTDGVASRPGQRLSPTTGDLLVRVFWSDGTPAAGIALFLTTDRFRQPLARVASDADGLARAGSLPPGKTWLHSDRGGEREATVLAGERQEVRFDLPAGVDVDGVVRDRAKAPVPGAEIWLTAPHRPWMGGAVVARADQDGAFRLRGAPASQSLGALAPGYAPSALVDLELLDAKNPPVRVELVLAEPGGALRGRVADARGEPVAGAMVAAGTPANRSDQRSSGTTIESWSPRTVTTDAAGKFLLAGLAPARHPVEVWAVGHPLWHGECAIAAGVTTELDVRLADGVTVHGTVRDAEGKAFVGAVVRAFPVAIRRDYLQLGGYAYDSTFGQPLAVADATGGYRLEHVAPGEVHLHARSISRPDRSEVLPWAETMLHGLPGAILEWNPTIESGPTIAGVVRYRDGVAMGGVFVTALEAGTGQRHTVIADSKGRFRFVRLLHKAHDLTVQYWSAPADAPALDLRDVWPDQGDVELVAVFDAPRKTPGGSVRGRVQDAARRVASPAALTVLLASKRSWRQGQKLVDGAFELADVEPGRYQLVVMSGEDPVHASPWFELQSAEAKDLGTLVTEPGGTLRLVLEREAGTEAVEPVIYLESPDLARARKVEPGKAREVLVENLSAGAYRISGHVDGIAPVRGDCRVVAGSESRTIVTLRPAARREIVVDYATTERLRAIQVRDASGAEHFQYRPKGATLARPYRRPLQLPLGRFTLEAETETGRSAQIGFDVTSLAEPEPPVRLELR